MSENKDEAHEVQRPRAFSTPLKALVAAGLDASDLKAAGFEPPALKKAGFNFESLREAGFDEAVLKRVFKAEISRKKIEAGLAFETSIALAADVNSQQAPSDDSVGNTSVSRRVTGSDLARDVSNSALDQPPHLPMAVRASSAAPNAATPIKLSPIVDSAGEFKLPISIQQNPTFGSDESASSDEDTHASVAVLKVAFSKLSPVVAKLPTAKPRSTNTFASPTLSSYDGIHSAAEASASNAQLVTLPVVVSRVSASNSPFIPDEKSLQIPQSNEKHSLLATLVRNHLSGCPDWPVLENFVDGLLFPVENSKHATLFMESEHLVQAISNQDELISALTLELVQARTRSNTVASCMMEVLAHLDASSVTLWQLETQNQCLQVR